MGPIAQGTLVSIHFKAYKDANSNFYLAVMIDTEAKIVASTASNALFYGRNDTVAVDSDNLGFDFYSVLSGDWGKVDSNLGNNSYLYMSFLSNMPTSAGSYV